MSVLKPPSYNNETRPPASSVYVGFLIYNTDDRQVQVSDGKYWRDPHGRIT